MNSSKIHVYCMPGMAANPKIFEYISLDKEEFELHLLSWMLPQKGESLAQYAAKMCERVVHENPVLMGVSFGGILIQEMAKLMTVKKLIVISSVKTAQELPKKMIFAKHTKLHKLIPTQLVSNLELVAKFAFGDFIQKRLELYERYLSVRDPFYIDWSIDCIVGWDQQKSLENTVHIQGTEDAVFPVHHLKDYIPVHGGTHSMIIFKYKWFNENLPSLIKSS